MLPSINILITNIIIIIDCCCCYCIIVLVIEGALLLYLVEAFRAGPVYQDVKTMEALDHCFKTSQPRIFFLPPFWFSLWTWQTDLITASRMLQCCSADCRLQSEREREWFIGCNGNCSQQTADLASHQLAWVRQCQQEDQTSLVAGWSSSWSKQ